MACVGLGRAARLLGLLGRLLQRGVDVLALVDHPLSVVGHLRALLAQALIPHRLERAHEVHLGAHRSGELDRLANCLSTGLGPVGTPNDRPEHQSPSPAWATSRSDHRRVAIRLTDGSPRRMVARWPRKPAAWSSTTTLSCARGSTCSSAISMTSSSSAR